MPDTDTFVSSWAAVTWSIDRPSSSAAIWRTAVGVPWPISAQPWNSVTVLSGVDLQPRVDLRRVGRAGERCRGGRAKRRSDCSDGARDAAPSLSPIGERRTPARQKGLPRELAASERRASFRTSLAHGRGCRWIALTIRGIGAAAAEMAVHRRADLRRGRPLGRREKIGGLDHHAVLAVAAMGYLQVDPRLLQRMELRRRARRATLPAPRAPAGPRAS